MNNSYEIEIGEKIKTLRKLRHITQEQLAEYLSISFQSVSKWERREAYPDVTMISKIALFFGVTTDELLCVDKAKAKQEIDEYLKRAIEAQSFGNTQKAIDIIREANMKYPGNFLVMDRLARAIWFHVCADDENKEKALQEIITLGERIRSECGDDNIRRDALQTMCFAYDVLGEKEKSEKLIDENLGDIYLTREVMLEHILDGERLQERRQYNLIILMEFCIQYIRKLASDFNTEGKLTVNKNILKIYSFLFPDKDYGYYHTTISSVHMDMAEIYLQQGECKKALENIETAAKHTIEFDNIKIPFQHTSLLVNQTDYTGMTKNYKGNQSYILLKQLENELYDDIREMAEYIDIYNDLQKHALEDA